jgi:manganese/iron transport system substrate-binding protein
MLTRLLSFLLILSVLPSCKREAAPSDGKKRILTTFTIIQDIAQNVVGDAAVVESITKPGAEIHDYEPTPQDLVKAQDADLVLWNGLGLERWFEKFLQQVRDVPAAVISDGVQPMSIGEGPYNGKPNPHAWMSPANAIRYVENIRAALVKLDPKNKAIYTANAAAYTEKLKAVDAPVRQKLETIPAAQRWLVSCEGAFSYLARDYDMKELYLWPVNADQEGTPQQVQKVVDTVRASQIPVVFSESTISDKVMLQVAKETGAKFGGVLYVDSLTEATGPAPTYLKLLETNADTIVKAFTGK